MFKKIKILFGASLLAMPIISISCGYTKYVDPILLKKIQDLKDPVFQKTKLNEYFKKTYSDKGYFVSDLKKSFIENTNYSNDSYFNYRPAQKMIGFTEEYHNEIKNYAFSKNLIKIPSKLELKKITDRFNIEKDSIDSIITFLNNYNKSPYANIDGYNLYNLKENPLYKGPKSDHVLIYAQGGPLPNFRLESGKGFSKGIFQNNIETVVLNDSQYSFDPIAANKAAHPNSKADAYLDAFKELFDIKSKKTNSQLLTLINFVMAYIDAQRLENLEDALIAQNKKPYLFGFSQGNTTLQMGMLMKKSILDKAIKIRPGNNSIRGFAGLYKENDTTNWNIQYGGGVLTASTKKEAISGDRGRSSALFAFSKRYINYSQGILNIYQKVFDTDPDFLKKYQEKVMVTYSNKDWNIGDLTPLEINFFEKNKLDLEKSPKPGHTIGFPISSYYDWMDLDSKKYLDYFKLKNLKYSESLFIEK